jgi:prophage tail gpP-like protein
VLRVNGREYGGWKTMRVTRGIEAIAGSFDVSVSEKWNGQSDPWPIIEEDEVVVAIGGETVLTGWVDKRSITIGADEHSFQVSGRDKAGALVDCSALLNDNGSSKAKKKRSWEFANVPLLTLAKKLGAVHGVDVVLDPPDLSLPAPAKKLSVEPGDTMFEVLDRACRLVGVLPVSDGTGGIKLMRPGTGRAHDALIEGQNIKTGSAAYDATGRFRTYEVHGQHPGTDQFSGVAAAAVSAEADDLNVRRDTRVLLVRAENALTVEYAKARAQWEAIVRAAKANSLEVVVVGWRQGNGDLWPFNKLVSMKSSRLGVDGDMLITQVEFSADPGTGKLTRLSLKPPNAFKPEPTLKSGGDKTWKEIRKGV